MISTVRRLSLAVGAAGIAVIAMASSTTTSGVRAAAGAERINARELRMSEMGAHAAAEVARLERLRTGIAGKAAERVAQLTGAPPPDPAAVRNPQDDDECQNDPRCGRGFRDGPRGGQAELSIAIDSTGQHIVVGFNDQRGFNLNPISVSGYMFSDDGGETFVDGGQLPSPGNDEIDGTLLPQVFGDPDVKYLGGCTFVYSSILIVKLRQGVAQTMGVHRSTDCGHTWKGPFEVKAATNPNGQFEQGNALDAADKEFIDVDPDTGRIIMTWTNFRFDFAVEMLSAWSDDGGRTWPASTRRVISGTPEDGQSSIPRFAGNGNDHVYVAWRRFPFPGTLFGYGNTIAVARSPDNGATWRKPVETSAEFLTQDMILGNDRSNTSPGLAVDNSDGAHQGSVYLVYPNNNNQDGSDIVFQKSTDRGRTFSAPLLLNSRPGEDRPQWFPTVSVDDVTGRVSVFYYDQGIARSGDLSEVTYTFSNDGGETWSKPRPLTLRPFNAGHNNDTGQPNLGDYNQGVHHDSAFLAAFALSKRPPKGFVDGQPDVTLTGIDATVRRVSARAHEGDYASVHVPNDKVRYADEDGDGYIEAGETVEVRVPLFNYVTNPLNAGSVRQPVVTMSSRTAGVEVLQGVGNYATIVPGATRSDGAFQIRVNQFAGGAPIELGLRVVSPDGNARLVVSIETSSPQSTTLLSENFSGVRPGRLPRGWLAEHGAGLTEVPWTTSNSFCGSNGAFHANDDVGEESTTRWERLFSPAFAVPKNSDYVVVEFDVCYDTEDDPVLERTAYDGLFLRVTDLTPGHTLRSVLAEAFTDEFRTGPIFHYPKHLPRSGDPDYFEDMSAWGGLSEGRKRVRMFLPGMQGTVAQLRFEFTQDSLFTCLDVRPESSGCGVLVDNIVVRSVSAGAP